MVGPKPRPADPAVIGLFGSRPHIFILFFYCEGVGRAHRVGDQVMENSEAILTGLWCNPIFFRWRCACLRTLGGWRSFINEWNDSRPINSRSNCRTDGRSRSNWTTSTPSQTIYQNTEKKYYLGSIALFLPDLFLYLSSLNRFHAIF